MPSRKEGFLTFSVLNKAQDHPVAKSLKGRRRFVWPDDQTYTQKGFFLL